jgi:hypothetical protein
LRGLAVASGGNHGSIFLPGISLPPKFLALVFGRPWAPENKGDPDSVAYWAGLLEVAGPHFVPADERPFDGNAPHPSTTSQIPGGSRHPASLLQAIVEIVVGTVIGAHFRADVTGIATGGRSLSLDRVHALNVFHLRENAVPLVRGRLEQKPGYGIGLWCIGLGDLLSTHRASIIGCPIRSLAVGTNLVILGFGIEEFGGGRFQRPSWRSIGGHAAGVRCRRRDHERWRRRKPEQRWERWKHRWRRSHDGAQRRVAAAKRAKEPKSWFESLWR